MQGKTLIGVIDGSKLYQILRAFCYGRESLSPVINALNRMDGIFFTSNLTLSRVISRISEKESCLENREVSEQVAKTVLKLLRIFPIEVSVHKVTSEIPLDEEDASIVLLAEELRKLHPESKIVIFAHDSDFWKSEVQEFLKEKSIEVRFRF